MKMALKGAKRNPATDKSLWRMRAHLERQRQDAMCNPGGVRELYENVFSNAPIGMALIDMEGRWLQVNHALCRITGYPEKELKAKTFRSLIHRQDINLDPVLNMYLCE
jgi:PAS domain-containing protein